MEWHIVTGEFPPQLGGVSDYTFLISRELSGSGDKVHVWAPSEGELEDLDCHPAEVHRLPGGFGREWLKELDGRLSAYSEPRNILLQYVPHMYGWKSMNLGLCWWIFRQRRHNVYVMFHEVAFPFRNGQKMRHSLLAVVHRAMAWTVLRSARHSFTSTEPYLALLRKIGGDKTPISMLRICSNIPLESYRSDEPVISEQIPRELFKVGIFSNFSPEIREALQPVIARLLENNEIAVALLGPGERFRESILKRAPEAAARISCTGRLHVTEIGALMRGCDALLQFYPAGASAARGTLIGAMASGVPLVTNAGHHTDRLLLDSKAMLFSDGSPDSVHSAIQLLKANPGLAAEIGGRAERLYMDAFQPAVIASRLREVAASVTPDHESAPEQEPVSR